MHQAKTKPLSQILLANMLLVATLSCLLVGFLWVIQETYRFNADIVAMRDSMISARKQRMKEQVDAAIAYLQFMRRQTDARTRSVIRERVNEAHLIATHLQEQYKDTRSRAELEAMVRETLRPIRFNNGRGYFFATRLDGVEQLCATCAHLEDTDLTDLQDTRGAYVIRDMAELVRKNGEGYYSYTWGKPDVPGKDYVKISFVKLFEPFQWFIGAGEYLGDVEEDLKQEALQWIQNIRYEQDGYVFAGRWDGASLSGPAIGMNMVEVTDPNGVKIVQKMIDASRNGGGFVEYVMPKLEGQRPEPKISYAAGVPEWQWYIGTGLYIDDIERDIAEYRRRSMTDLFYNIGKILVSMLFLWFAVFMLVTWISRKMRRMFATFLQFFSRGVDDQQEIPAGDLPVQEFRELAEAANMMIAERRSAEEALREKSEELEGYFTFSLDLLCIANSRGEFVRLNPEWEKILGYPPAELDGRSFLELVHPDDLQATLDAISVLSSQQDVLNFENRYRCADGSYRWIEWRSRQKDDLIYAVARDITDRKKTDEMLKASEATFRNIVQASPMGIHLYRLEDEDRLVFVGGNPAADRLLNVDNRQFIGKAIEEAFPSLRDTEIPLRYRRAAQFGESWQTEQVEYTDGKVSGAFEVYVFQMSPGNAAVLFNEITSRKQAEEERQNLQMQLIQAQKMESVGRLAGGVAHDFNNMLGVILGLTELTLAQVDPELPLFANLQEIRKAAERSTELTRQLLTFARKQTIEPKVLNLNETVEAMLKMLGRLIGEDIDLIWKPGRNILQVNVDPSQVDQLLVNLGVNARDAIEGVGKITIETDAAQFDEAFCADHPGFVPGDYVQLAVSDNGCGMGPETLSLVFEPFFTTKEMGKGTGLGLASVYGMVKQNNGFINVYSEPGQGTTFKVYFPRHTSTSAPLPEKAPAQPLQRGHETILLVEDEPIILKMTTMMLEMLGYTVIGAESPGEAIRLANEYSGRLDLLLTDVVMPKMNGRDLAENLLSHYPNLKCLFMSGYTADVIAHHGVLDEGTQFIQKPFSVKDLEEKLREALEG